MKCSVKYTSQFKKEFKNMLKRGCNQNEMQHIINLIAEGTNSRALRKVQRSCLKRQLAWFQRMSYTSGLASCL